MAIIRFKTLVDKLSIAKGTQVTYDNSKDNIGKTGQLLCSVGNGSLFYKEDELEEIK